MSVAPVSMGCSLLHCAHGSGASVSAPPSRRKHVALPSSARVAGSAQQLGPPSRALPRKAGAAVLASASQSETEVLTTRKERYEQRLRASALSRQMQEDISTEDSPLRRGASFIKNPPAYEDVPLDIQRRGALITGLFLAAQIVAPVLGNPDKLREKPNMAVKLVHAISLRFQTSIEKYFDIMWPNKIINDGTGVFLQGFNWESSKYSWYKVLSVEARDIAKSFTGVWMPPPCKSADDQGYLPKDFYDLNSEYGTEEELIECIKKLHEHNVLAIADIVINHRASVSYDSSGAMNGFEGLSLPWGPEAITSDNPTYNGQGRHGTGVDFPAVPNIDHTNERVQQDLTEWLQYLKKHVGFDAWRFDYVKGYGGEFVKQYVRATEPRYSVGEFWDTMDYVKGKLALDQDAHRQRTVNWIHKSGGVAQAFDFTTKGILQEAVANSEYFRLRDKWGNPPGVIGVVPSRAMTFLDNHDTGSTQGFWPFPKDKVLQGYAYLFTHPGMPCVFWDHYFEWGPRTQAAIRALVRIRKENGIHSRSQVNIVVADFFAYGAVIDEKIAVRLGKDTWRPSDRAGEKWKVEFERPGEFCIWKRV
mmetsp:Transcript_2728/g.9920  ORF Transcript_2728/g.9920 Transcript_2728/m.9920 type:complete len:589 (-) Transcript_2728:3935-5701(-)